MNDNSEDLKSSQKWLEETLVINGEPTEFPKVLYKFVSCESKYFPLAAHELLLHSRIRFSSRNDFNDPFDTVIPITKPTAKFGKAYLRYLYEKHGVALPEVREFETRSEPENILSTLCGKFDRLGIYSLSSSVINPLMWAHYACSHKGLAFIFNQSTDIPEFCAFPIRYQKNNQKLHLNSTSSIDEISLATLNKGIDWLYEREWRLLKSNQAGQWMQIQTEILKGIVFGALCSRADFEFVKELADRRLQEGLPKLEMYSANLNDDKFQLEFKKLETDGWIACSLQ